MQISQKPWQVQVQGQIYEAELEELKQWIVEGSVMPSDNVRRGDLRWLPAEKVPALYKSFSLNNTISPAAIQASAEPPDSETVSTARDNSDSEADSPLFKTAADSSVDIYLTEGDKITARPNDGFCYWHEELPTAYACDICENFFCKNCPKSFGGSVKLCPLCGSLCRKIDEPVNVQKAIGLIHKPYTQIDESISEEKNKSAAAIDGIGKSLAGSLKHYKNQLFRRLGG